jgi:Zn-dependent alcohol dehydrogenase
MKIKAAVLREPKKPYTIEELELEPPRQGEVLIRYAYTGYCHSDLHLQLGEIPIALPLVAGHECSGIVEDVGPGVTRVKKGDHVVGTWMVPCGVCPACRRGMGNEILHGNFVSGFSNYSVVPEGAAIPIRKDFPLEWAAFMGCCVPTGWGTVTNTANIQPGDSVAVYGLGGVGLNVLRACVMRHANPVIAVDLEASKKSLAMEFGATHFICNSKEDPVPKIQETPELSSRHGGLPV